MGKIFEYKDIQPVLGWGIVPNEFDNSNVIDGGIMVKERINNVSYTSFSPTILSSIEGYYNKRNNKHYTPFSIIEITDSDDYGKLVRRLSGLSYNILSGFDEINNFVLPVLFCLLDLDKGDAFFGDLNDIHGRLSSSYILNILNKDKGNMIITTIYSGLFLDYCSLADIK